MTYTGSSAYLGTFVWLKYLLSIFVQSFKSEEIKAISAGGFREGGRRARSQRRAFLPRDTWSTPSSEPGHQEQSRGDRLSWACNERAPPPLVFP